MSKRPNRGHLGAEELQALLDGTLATSEADAARKHLDQCARCRAEHEAWQLLFQGLGEMHEVDPGPGFADRVMESLPRERPERVPLAARVKGWLGLAPRPERDTGRHLGAGAIQDFLEGVVPEARVAAMETHLEGCRFCREEVDAWRKVMVGLDDVPRLAPSPAFAERVMAHVRVRNAASVARAGWKERALAWLEGVSPTTKKRAAGLAGAAVTPVVTAALLAYVVLSHPLVTLGNLVSFVWLQAQDLLVGAGAGSAGDLLQSLTGLQPSSVVEFVTQSPQAAAAAFAAFGGLTLMALWVLYRNLLTTEPVDDRYAHFSF